MLLALLGLGPALPMLHFAVIEHQVCPTHGELMHAHGSAALEQSAPARGARSEALPSADDEHAHEHCALSAAGTERTAIGRRSVGLRDRVGRAVVRPAHVSEHAHKSLALLAYAPKLAPPGRS